MASGDAEIQEEDFRGRVQHRLVPRRPADLSVFSAEERQTIDDIFDQLSGLTARQVSDLSHEEPGWQLTAEGETIPWAAVHWHEADLHANESVAVAGGGRALRHCHRSLMFTGVLLPDDVVEIVAVDEGPDY